MGRIFRYIWKTIVKPECTWKVWNIRLFNHIKSAQDIEKEIVQPCVYYCSITDPLGTKCKISRAPLGKLEKVLVSWKTRVIKEWHELHFCTHSWNILSFGTTSKWIPFFPSQETCEGSFMAYWVGEVHKTPLTKLFFEPQKKVNTCTTIKLYLPNCRRIHECIFWLSFVCNACISRK